MRLLLLTLLGLVQAATASNSAWSDFVSYKAPAVVPEGSIDASNLASTYNPGAISGSAIIQPSTQAGLSRSVTVNGFVAMGASGNDGIKARILKLCKAGSKGTEFNPSGFTEIGDDIAAMPPQCMYCLAKGWGTNEATPGFYLPCGCQRVCVDVSGNTQGTFANGRSGTFTAGAMTTCQDYIDNGIVTTCAEVARYHIVLWPSLIGVIILLYVAYSMAYMQLDMDSLLYEAASSNKEA